MKKYQTLSALVLKDIKRVKIFLYGVVLWAKTASPLYIAIDWRFLLHLATIGVSFPK